MALMIPSSSLRARRAIVRILFLSVAFAGGAVALFAEPSRSADAALIPARINTEPGREYSADVLNYAMVLGVARSPQGRLWAAWIAGGDDENGLLVAASSDDGGATWSSPRLVIDPPDASDGVKCRTLVGNLWTDPLGRLWLFYDQSMGYFDGRAGVWAITCDNPDSKHPTWSAPRRLWHGCTLNKPTVLPSGEWLLPVSLWPRDVISPSVRKKDVERLSGVAEFKAAYPELDTQRMAHVFVSRDQGATWSRRGGVAIPDPRFDEHMLVKLKDGRLWLLARTRVGMAESFSSDDGASWESARPSSIAHVSSRFHLRRLASGRLLLIKHGRIEERTPARSHLTAYLSEDDGASWLGGLLLDERKGVSYPDACEMPDGSLCVVYDHNRATDSEILMARFSERDVLERSFVTPGAKPRMLVHKALGPKKTKK